MGVISQQAFTFRLVANDVELDLFADEDILLSNNVTGLFDIGVLPSDFTRQITLPGTKKNNAFFEHCYDISINNPFIFATNQKVPAYFDFDSIYLSQGYLQLNKVNVRANKFIESYEVTIYGTLSSFGRDVNKYFLTDLDNLSIYNHTSSVANISASWGGNLFNGDIVYPMADYGSGWVYSAGTGFYGIDDYNGGMTVQDWKPAIKAKVVWDKIFEFTGYTYSSSFFNDPMWDNIYMICNNALRYPEYSGVDLEGFGVVKIGAIPSSSLNAGNTNINIPMSTTTRLPWVNIFEDRQNFIGTGGSYNLPINSRLRGIANFNVNISCSVNNLPTSWELHYWPTGSTPGGAGSGYTILPDISNYFTRLVQSRQGSINQDFEVQMEFATSYLDSGSYYFGLKLYEYYVTTDPTVTLDPNNTTKSYLQIKKVDQAADGRVMDIQSNMPYGTSGIKLIDFIVGLQKKFNLVIYADKTKPNQFIIETFNNWYNRGEVKDFNKYINLDEPIEVISANNLAVNKLNFGDSLDQDYISQQFSKGANREFGKQYYIDTTNYFSQGEFNVKTTFASTPLARLAGTGLSGSVGGINPTVYTFYAGTLTFSPSSNPAYVCSSPITFDVYTISGTLTQGEILYYDRYAQSPVTGFYNFVAGAGLEVTDMNRTTGEIGYGTGYFC